MRRFDACPRFHAYRRLLSSAAEDKMPFPFSLRPAVIRTAPMPFVRLRRMAILPLSRRGFSA